MPISPRSFFERLMPSFLRDTRDALSVVAGVKPYAPDQLVLTVKALAGRLDRQEARTLAATLATADAPKLAAIDRLAKQGRGTLTALPEGRLVRLKVPAADGPVRVTTADGGHVLRVDTPRESVLYRDGVPFEDFHPEGSEAVVVHRLGREERWNARGTAATVDGRPIQVPTAPRVAGEAPRGPWAPQPNRFVFPAAEANKVRSSDWGGYDAFARKLDENEVAAGGAVLIPTSRVNNYQDPGKYNCHSWGLTGGEGDLAHPATSFDAMRWLPDPLFELTNGRWGALAPDQRAHVGDRILYRKDGGITHTGIVAAVDADGHPSRIQSKWGAWGLFEHDPFTFPNSHGVDYGAPAELYRPL